MLEQLSFRAMGCEILAFLEHEEDSKINILEEIPVWFEEWEQIFSRFRLNSDLSQLNRTFDQPVEVSEAFWKVFQTALWANEYSGGMVTPTVLDSMLEVGYDRPFDILPREQFYLGSTNMITEHPLSMIVADASNRTITLPKGVHLDFGGVAKGWAAHQTVERIKQYGPCLVNAGGDIAISEPRMDGEAWLIGISNPFETGTDIEVLKVKRGGIASSGKDRRHWNQNGVLRHHIINPLTGLSAETDLLRVTVLAPTVMEAEAAAKAAFILGYEAGLQWIEEHNELAGVMILETGELIHSQNMQEYF